MNRCSPLLLAALLTAYATSSARAADANALPPDGGAPFAAYNARIAAIHAADWSAWKQVTAPNEIAAEIAEAGSDAAAAVAFAEMASFLRQMIPIRAEFIDGERDGDHATLRVRTTRPTTQAQGDAAPVLVNQVEMRQQDGHWYVDNEHLLGIADRDDIELGSPAK